MMRARLSRAVCGKTAYANIEYLFAKSQKTLLGIHYVEFEIGI